MDNPPASFKLAGGYSKGGCSSCAGTMKRASLEKLPVSLHGQAHKLPASFKLAGS